MKKLLFSLGLLVIASGASFAYLENGTTSSLQVIERQGYSDAMLRVLDTAKAHHGETGYTKQYSTKKKTPYTVIKNYFDPIQDDGDFAEHQINFGNNWNGDETEYSSPYNQPVENL